MNPLIESLLLTCALICFVGRKRLWDGGSSRWVLALPDALQPAWSVAHWVSVGFPFNGYNASFFFFFVFLGPHPRHMEVSRLGVESEL